MEWSGVATLVQVMDGWPGSLGDGFGCGLTTYRSEGLGLIIP